MPLSPSVRTALFAFSATLLVAAGVFTATLADRYATALASIDTEVLLLFLPCCLLLFAVIVEAIRMAARGPINLDPPARPLAWNVLSDDR
jgi:hypothetical protein